MTEPDPPHQRLAGVDGCRSGWVVATEHGAFVVARIDRSLAETIGVDMPIGLPHDRPRRSDRDARKFLGARRSSVFPTPARACLAAGDYQEALDLSRAALGVGISKQAYHLLPKIRELDQLVAPGDDRFVEIHPECAFLVMNELEPLAPKRTSAGAARRQELLQRSFGTLPEIPRGAQRDDLFDAYAVLWSAQRFVAGTHRTFGAGGGAGAGAGAGACSDAGADADDLELDARGLVMRIVC